MDEEYARKKALMDWIVAGMAGRHYPKPEAAKQDKTAVAPPQPVKAKPEPVSVMDEVQVKPSKNPDSWVYPAARTLHRLAPNSVTKKIMERHGGDYTPEKIRDFYREDLIESCQDLVNDKAKNHPEYKDLLGKAKFFDRLWPLNVIPCNTANYIIELDETN